MVTAGRTGRWSRHDVFTTVRLFSLCLNVPSLFGLDGNVKQLIIVASAQFKLMLSGYPNIPKERIVLIIMEACMLCDCAAAMRQEADRARRPLLQGGLFVTAPTPLRCERTSQILRVHTRRECCRTDKVREQYCDLATLGAVLNLRLRRSAEGLGAGGARGTRCWNSGAKTARRNGLQPARDGGSAPHRGGEGSGDAASQVSLVPGIVLTASMLTGSPDSFLSHW